MHSNFRGFSGEFRKEQRVSLAGRSRTEETRAQVLERTRRERERRRQEKLEHKSATTIQAAWKGWCARQRHQAEVRQEWVARYGQQAERASSADLAPDSGFLRSLCYFAKTEVLADVHLLAAACRLVLTSQQASGGASGGTGMLVSQHPRLLLCTYATAGKEPAGAVLQQSQQLVALCLAALAQHSVQLAMQLQQPRVGPAAATASGTPVPPMLEVLLLLTASDSWKPLGAASTDATAQILAAAIDRGLFGQLASIAAAACPEDGHSGGVAAQRQVVPGGEALATALTVRFLSQQQAVAKRHQRHQPHARWPPTAVAEMLSLPLLLRRLPTLKPVAARLWHQTVSALHALPATDLAAWLRARHGLGPGSPGAAAGAAAALLGNLLEGAAIALKVEDSQQLAAARQLALQFAALTSSLLSLLPQHPFFPHNSQGSAREDDDDEEQAAFLAARFAAQAAKLPWDPEQLPSSGLMSQLQLVSDGGLLRALVRAILPVASAADSITQQGQLHQRARDVQKLCGLLQQLMALPGQRQRVLVMLAFSAELIQRLWFSYLRPAQMAPGEGWVPSADAACDPGWMLPLNLFSLAYSTFIITAGDDELYQAQRPLPLAELHDGRGGGVLALLKMALWHALWVEVAPSSGGWLPEAAALRLQLKQGAGKLMGQLHSRNCRHAFAPPEAFQIDALPADRFQSEIQAGTAAGRHLSEAGSGRAWGLLAFAPFLVPFRERAKLFQAVVAQERARYREMEVMHSLAHEFGAANHFYPINRTQVLQDAFEKLSNVGEALHGRIRIQFIDAHGLEEAGVDGGGIFKEFIETVVQEGFDPNVGLFKATTDNRLYPNPHAQLVVENGLRLIEFLGAMLGKAMYEGILVELPITFLS